MNTKERADEATLQRQLEEAATDNDTGGCYGASGRDVAALLAAVSAAA